MSATCSTGRRRAASRSCARSRSSSRTTPRGRSRRWRRSTTRRIRGRDAQGALRARALDRARRLHGGPAQQVLPPRPGPRGAAALRLLRDLHRRGQECGRRDRRAPLHLRSGHARRRRARRAQGQGHAALGVAGARRARRGPALRPPFHRPDPGADGDPFADLNPDSETVLDECLVEPALAELPVGETVQFERLGYFCLDPDSTPERLVFNRTLGLRDTWARVQAKDRRS